MIISTAAHTRRSFTSALLLAVTLPDMVADLRRYAPIVPETEGLFTMGARNLFIAFKDI